MNSRRISLEADNESINEWVRTAATWRFGSIIPRVPNSSIADFFARSTRVRAATLLGVVVLALLSGCADSDAGQAAGSDAAWSTGGGSSADADPVPSRPASSAAVRGTEKPGEPENVSPEVPSQDGPDVASGDPDDSNSSPREADSLKSGTARSELEGLLIKGKEYRAGDEPELFDWRSDVDDNGCDTREDALRRDLENLVIEAGTQGCTVAAGDLEDDYLGDSYAYERGSAAVDIDHLVSSANAQQTGASALSDEALRQFASDPLNLLTVSSDLKRQKDGADAATWLPPNTGYQCEYVSRQIAVKHKYGLWVAAPEKDAMQSVLDTCADQPAFAEDVAWPKPGADDGAKTEPADEETSRAHSARSSDEPYDHPSQAPRGSADESSTAPTRPAVGSRRGDG